MAEQTRHTPGPWLDERNGWIGAANGSSVVEYEGCGSHAAEWPNPADKTLALAAPDLLEALQTLVYVFDDSGMYDAEVFAAARAAIAKATGGA